MYYRREQGDFSCLCLESLRISTMLKSSWGWDKRSKSRFSWLVEGYTRALLSRTWWWSTLWDRLESTWGEGMVLWLLRREQGSSHMQRTHAMMAQGQQARWALSEAMGETVPCLCTSFSECWQSLVFLASITPPGSLPSSLHVVLPVWHLCVLISLFN